VRCGVARDGLEVEAAIAQELRESRCRAVAVRCDDDACAVGQQVAQPVRQPLAVVDDRSPIPSRSPPARAAGPASR
jgi:hypothetical protein